jgi:adenylate cyclase
MFSAVACTLAFYLYYFVSFWSVKDHYIEGPLRTYMEGPTAHIELVLGGVMLGGLIGVINRLTEAPRLRNRSAFQMVLIQTALYIVAVATVFALLFGFFALFILPMERIAEIFSEIAARQAVSLVAWMVLVVTAINMALELERVVGPGVLWRLLIGRYRRPHTERRTFLFMDLKGSTTIAESLGHRRYSELLQECFRDLTPVVLTHDAAVYQFVGDEVVLSWRCAGDGCRESASVEAFFQYRATLSAKAEFYQSRFGVKPEFRGGVDVGPVTVIEVGDVKREIVFHGDVLNTAARLLELGKTKGHSLMVSSAVGESVDSRPGVERRWRGELILRGKTERVGAYSLELTGS